jgi:hypothetical protein
MGVPDISASFGAVTECHGRDLAFCLFLTSTSSDASVLFAMHRCWDVLELTRMIFEQLESIRLAPNRPPVRKEASLYRLALTCRKFTDPAVTLLWESQDGIMPLLKCLPSHKWEISEGSFVSRSTSLRIGRSHECNSPDNSIATQSRGLGQSVDILKVHQEIR